VKDYKNQPKVTKTLSFVRWLCRVPAQESTLFFARRVMWGQSLRQRVSLMCGQLAQWWRCVEWPWAHAKKASQQIAVDIDLAWVNGFDMRLTNALHADDVWFQLQAEAAARLHVSTEASTEVVALDFIATHDSAASQVLYRVFAIPKEVLTRLQMALTDMGLHLSRLGVVDAQGLCPPELSAINFLPHRQMRCQQRKRQLAWRCLAALLCGWVLAVGLQSVGAFWLAQTGIDDAARLQSQQTLQDTQAQLDAAQHLFQQQTQRQSQHQAQQQSRHQQQQQTLQWQAVLHEEQAAIWYAQLGQDGSAWHVSGLALAKADVQRLQSRLARLRIWQTPPALKRWVDSPPAPHVRMPVWEFELAGVLATVTPEVPPVGREAR
jgi:Tfp pilus assembly protein PilN